MEVSKEPKEPLDLADIYIGTAGYNYSHWRNEVFYPKSVKQAGELRHYSGVFNAVEINASFHAVPRLETLHQWAQKAKACFVLSFKVPQDITHNKRLENIGPSLVFFLNRLIEGLGNKDRLGPILFQLPPSLYKNADKLHQIRRILDESRNLQNLMIAFEFRHQSWYCDEIYNVLRQYKFGLCENISPDGSTHHVPHVAPAGTWHYIRFHKKRDQSITLYSDDQLNTWSKELVSRRRHGIIQYCYFLNDHEGNGPKNARTLAKIIKKECPGPLAFHSGWKEDAAAPNIKSMFAKAARGNSSGTIAATPMKSEKTTGERCLDTSFDAAKKRPVPGIKKFFGPATSRLEPSTVSTGDRKRHKQQPSQGKATTKKDKPQRIDTFFSPKA